MTLNLTEQLAHVVVAFHYSGVSPEALKKAEQLIADSLACAIGSAAQ